MFDNGPLQENGLPAYEASESYVAPKDPTEEEVKGILARIVREPGEIIALVRAGKIQQASVRCMVAGGLALGFAMIWVTVVPVVALLGLVMVMPAGADTKSLLEAGWILDVVMIAALIPSLIAYLIVPVASLPGTMLGFASLLQAESNKLGAIGVSIGNLLVSGGWAFAALVVIAVYLGLAG